jgi:hypothetical protein
MAMDFMLILKFRAMFFHWPTICMNFFSGTKYMRLSA